MEENTTLNGINVEEEMKKDAEYLQTLQRKTIDLIKSVIRFSIKTKDGKEVRPTISAALEYLYQLDNQLKKHFIYKSVHLYYTIKRTFIYFATELDDPKAIIDALNVLTEKPYENIFFAQFIIANHNPWSSATTTCYRFFNVQPWDEKDAKSFYGSFGEVFSIEQHGNSDTVLFSKLNWKLLYYWHLKFIKNKKKVTTSFELPNSRIVVKLTSKLKCFNCNGYGHHTEACSKELLPLLAEISKSIQSSEIVDNENTSEISNATPEKVVHGTTQVLGDNHNKQPQKNGRHNNDSKKKKNKKIHSLQVKRQILKVHQPLKTQTLEEEKEKRKRAQSLMATFHLLPHHQRH
jgi:hypothetical protein